MDPAEFCLDPRTELIDLTHPMTPGMPTWPTHPHYCQEIVESYDRGDVACNHRLEMSEHTGTHFDAPLHFVRDGASILDMPLTRFFGRLATISCTGCAPCELVGPDRIRRFEDEHGALAAGDAVLFHFGWDRFWADPALHQHFLADWPGLSAEASELLVDRRAGIVGSDCLSIDGFANTTFPAHRILLGAGVLVGENFANLGRLPAYCHLAALPLAIEGGSGAPARAVAFVRRGEGRS